MQAKVEIQLMFKTANMDGKEFKAAGTGDARFLSSETFGNFTGIMLGLWAESPSGKGYADFEYFEYNAE